MNQVRFGDVGRAELIRMLAGIFRAKPRTTLLVRAVDRCRSCVNYLGTNCTRRLFSGAYRLGVSLPSLGLVGIVCCRFARSGVVADFVLKLRRAKVKGPGLRLSAFALSAPLLSIRCRCSTD